MPLIAASAAPPAERERERDIVQHAPAARAATPLLAGLPPAAPLPAALLAALMCIIAFLPGDIEAAYQPLLRISNAIAGIVLLLTGVPTIRALGWRGLRMLWPVAFLLVIVLAASFTAFNRTIALRDAAVFASATMLTLATASACRDAASRRVITGVALVCLIAIGVLVLRDSTRSLPAFNGRVIFYPSVRQWGGYPELALLAGMGLSAGTGLLLLAPASTPARPRRTQVLGLLLAAFFTIVSLVLLSRAAWLASLITSGLLMLLAIWRGVRYRAALAFIASTIPIVLLVSLALPPVRHYVQTMSHPLQEPTVSMRLDEWQTAWRIFLDHPWLGAGPGSYATMAVYYQAPTGVHAHNLVLHAGAEMGIFGAVAMLMLFVAAIWWAGRAALRGEVTALIVFSVLLFFLVRSEFDYFFSLGWPIARAHLFVAMWVGLAFGIGLDEAVTSPRTR
jgi:O-antigen ligase